MVQCFVPDCNHQSTSKTCKFRRFPANEKLKVKWMKVIRRQDRDPNTNSRICTCHFEEGRPSMPCIFKRNENKYLRTTISTVATSSSSTTAVDPSSSSTTTVAAATIDSTLHFEDNELLFKNVSTQTMGNFVYSCQKLDSNTLRMETGLPSSEVFFSICKYVKSMEEFIVYYKEWKVSTISIENQVFICLMKLRQNYTNLHLANLFNCSVTTISNIIHTFLNVLHELLFVELMHMPSADKNNLDLPDSFKNLKNCRVILDCTDIKIEIPNRMDQQASTYSSYRGYNSFKLLLGVAPNGVINYVSELYPGNTSDKNIVRNCGILNQLKEGDLVLADKGFLIHDILPTSMLLNIPPFLHHGHLTENEVIVTRNLAKCRIHVERANARLKDFKILHCIPHTLRTSANKVVQLIATLVNFQHPLIKKH